MFLFLDDFEGVEKGVVNCMMLRKENNSCSYFDLEPPYSIRKFIFRQAGSHGTCKSFKLVRQQELPIEMWYTLNSITNRSYGKKAIRLTYDMEYPLSYDVVMSLTGGRAVSLLNSLQPKFDLVIMDNGSKSESRSSTGMTTSLENLTT